MGIKRREHGAETKARAALEALKGDKPINEIASRYEVHPMAVTRWKQRVLAELPRIFPERSAQEAAETAARETKLYEQIGRLKMELEWLKKDGALELRSCVG